MIVKITLKNGTQLSYSNVEETNKDFAFSADFLILKLDGREIKILRSEIAIQDIEEK